MPGRVPVALHDLPGVRIARVCRCRGTSPRPQLDRFCAFAPAFVPQAISDPKLRSQCFQCLTAGLPADKSQCDKCQQAKYSPEAQSMCLSCMTLGNPSDKSYCTACLDAYKDKDTATDLLPLQQKCLQCAEACMPGPDNRPKCLTCPYQFLKFRNARVEVTQQATLGCMQVRPWVRGHGVGPAAKRRQPGALALGALAWG